MHGLCFYSPSSCFTWTLGEVCSLNTALTVSQMGCKCIGMCCVICSG